MSAGGVLSNIKTILQRLKAHNVTVASAGIAFYGLLALVPTLIALVSVYGLVADPSDIETQVADVAGSLDGSTRDFLVKQLQDIVGEVEQTEAGEAADGSGRLARWSALVLSVGLALFSASGAVQKLMTTISVAYQTGEERPGIKVRGLAYGFTAAAIVGVAFLIFAIGVLPAVLDRVDMGGGIESVIGVGRLPVAGLLFAGALTVLYRYGPDRSPRTPWRNPGAVVATLLFAVFAVGFGVYTSNVGALPASYGLLGSIAALMILLQLTALAVIVGAEVNGMVEGRRVTERGAQPSTASNLTTSGTEPAAPIGFGKALAGLAALFALARAASRR